ncbi:anti-sigma factor [Sinorhizobium sp. BG8]|uniref:anti-sigma factor family protein n=1 Tax=Sinorhizobium sp. BG8 TaxID=2613773 RepID=UPI00193E0F27|nr:anti-sigma factor [Sinorhizobium sp. BG8]QRM56311.1 anti-sigma factor [Sinorhizobium sp. BG8]
MESTQGLPLEVRLSAYLDGQLPETEIDEIDDMIAKDDTVRKVFDRLKLGSDLGAKAFNDILNEPVPLRLVRGIKQAPSEPFGNGPSATTASLPEPANKNTGPTSYWPRALLASLALVVIGGGLGYVIGERQDSEPPQLGSGRTWIDEIADYHRIYSRQSAHLVEVPASERDHIVSWLTKTTGVTFNVPDLSDKNITFQGARLLVTGGKPTGQLLYKGEDGDVFAICFLKSEPVDEQTDMIDTMRDDIGLISWQRGNGSFVVVGPSADPDLEALAARVAATI